MKRTDQLLFDIEKKHLLLRGMRSLKPDSDCIITEQGGGDFRVIGLIFRWVGKGISFVAKRLC